MFLPEEIIQQERDRRAARLMILFAILGAALGGAIFVGLMVVTAQIQADMRRAAALRTHSQTVGLKAQLDVAEPRARRDKAGLHAAWEEDCAVLAGRIYLSPVLDALASYRLARGEFWYSEISVTLLSAPTTRGQSATSPLLANRELSASGVVQIVDSDIVTQEALAGVGRQISENEDLTRVVGVPTYELNFEEAGGGGPLSGRYARFIVRARRDFAGTMNPRRFIPVKPRQAAPGDPKQG